MQKKYLIRFRKGVLLFGLSFVSALSLVSTIHYSAGAVASPPICNFSQNGNGLKDFQAGKCVCDYSYYQTNAVTFYSPCPEACSAGSLVSATLKGADNREKIFNYFISQGLSNEQASGILGNIQSESGRTYSPTINEFSQKFPSGGYGIVQWTGDRRQQVVDYLTKQHPDLMAKYYVSAYSTNTTERTSYTGKDSQFIPKNANTNESMSPADNDALLLSELDFLMSETTGRVINPQTASKVSGISVGDNEWESVKKQTTIEGASNIWVYNYEVPSPDLIEATAKARIVNGQAMFALYGQASTVDTNNCNDGLTGPTRAKVVQVAEAEFALWKSGQMNKGTDFDKYLFGNGETEWCAYFASWVYKTAGYPVKDDDSAIANVSGFQHLGEAGQKFDIHPADGSYVPQPGDLALYGYHINIVVAVSPDNPRDFTTIGGNEGGEKGDAKWNTSFVKKTSGTYWAGEAEYYVSPKG